jgi:hypothetical protein
MTAAALVIACGGDGDDGAVSPPPPTYVKISAANQDAVARTSISSIMPFIAVPAVGQSAGPALAKTAEAGMNPTLGRHGGLTHLALRAFQVGTGQATAVPAGMARPLAQLPPETVPCTVSGTVTAVLDDKDNSKTPTVGDTLSISFNQCDEGDGTVNGSMVLAIASFTQTTTVEDVTDVTGSIAFQSLTITSAPLLYSVNGSATFRFTFTSKTGGEELFTSFTVASDGLTVAKQGVVAGGPSDSFSYRAGYTVSDRDFFSTDPGVPSSEIISASGDFRSQSLGGDLTISTITPFKSVYTDSTGDIFPTEGQLLVNGADGTRLRLTATQTVQVLMETSDDSDAEWEYSKLVTWDWLLS